MDVDSFLRGLGDIFAAGRLDEVSDYLRAGLAAAEAENDRHAVVTVLNEMIGYFRSISDYAEAIAASEYAVAEMTALGYEDSVAFGTTLLNAATAYRASGDNGKALELYRRARDIYAARLPENDPRLAGLYNNISAIHQEAGDHERAADILRKALAILRQGEGGRIEAATVHTNLAVSLLALNREDEAMEELRAALEIFEQDGGMDRAAPSRRAPHYAAALACLAGVYYTMKRFDLSARVYESALAQIRLCFGENTDFAVTAGNCALALEAAGQHEKAAEYRKHAEAIPARIGGA